jgi:hypothetical protein
MSVCTTPTEKRCSGGCGVLPIAQFSQPDGLHYYCRRCVNDRCRAYAAANPAKTKARRRRYRLENVDTYEQSWRRGNLRKFGLTQETYDVLLRSQGGVCAICRTAKPGGRGRWHIDHDHACCPTGRACEECRRGLLCSHCNLLLGHAADEPVTLDAAAAYLREHQL